MKKGREVKNYEELLTNCRENPNVLVWGVKSDGMSQKILHDRRPRDVLVYGSIRWRKSGPKPMQACIHGQGGDHSFKFKFFPKKERKTWGIDTKDGIFRV